MESAKLVLLSLLLFWHQTCSGSHDTIAANESISDGSLVISRGGRFALGFFSPGSSSYRYLGIWYHDIGEQTVVWVANRNDPITGTSGILTGHGYCNLFLYSNSSSKLPLWSANVSAGSNGTCVAQLLDSGNFVLKEGAKGERKMYTVWQSFDYPTDTLLPGIKVGLNRRTGLSHLLTSWRSADDPGTGNFSFELNPSGSPQFFLYQGTSPYWRSVPWPWESNHDFFNDTFDNNEDGIYYSTAIMDSSVYMRAVVDPSGILKSMTWDEGDGRWKAFYASPKQKCDFYGTCGPNSKCDPSIVFPYECACLPGYEPRFPKKWHLRDGSGGCVRKRAEATSICGEGEGFVRVEKVKLPDTSAAVWVGLGTSKLNCEGECRKNCACSAYATIDIGGKGIGCLQWHGAMMDTVDFPLRAYDLYVRVDALELADYLKDSSGFVEFKLKISIIVPSVVSVWIVIALLAYLWLRKWKKRRGMAVKNRLIRNLFHTSDGSNYFETSEATKDIKHSTTIYPELPFFNLGTIQAATNNFSPTTKLGQGGFALVYKGKLPNGQEVAVKRLTKNSSQGLEQLKNEVLLIAKLQHRNLVKLHGCCIEDGEQMLVYEYLPYNSLDSLLFVVVDDSQRLFLDWRKRFNIIIGIARGVLYLHQDSRFRIIHRDLKPSNILLDAELNPKISDFGMARMLDYHQTEGKTSRICGTYGYMSPEYALFGRFSVKSDVFSFGVILLETVAGRKINWFSQQDPSLSLIGHVWELWRAGRAAEVVDSSLMLKDSNVAIRCIQVGLLCVEENPADRPDMQAVVLMLNSETTPLRTPNRPAFVCVRSKVSFVKEPVCSVNEMSFSGIFNR
ncbi:unnamed protein product [Linum tenue]|uniref:Receptor-like serine/threonine-protein kinase n=1 Tax=Linum tenue TaxID=586396 RepID=A0AAV0JCE3_9ROSI|nr:unnamed protein product [Linum tenue]